MRKSQKAKSHTSVRLLTGAIAVAAGLMGAAAPALACDAAQQGTASASQMALEPAAPTAETTPGEPTPRATDGGGQGGTGTSGSGQGGNGGDGYGNGNGNGGNSFTVNVTFCIASSCQHQQSGGSGGQPNGGNGGNGGNANGGNANGGNGGNTNQ
ncbi:hypothetical protein ACH4U7_16675 [Streptomyces sp. NPDC020845]|uniref:hypothetical protein n=1 Tax=Streptomyces sp. NPDC020845 TaxID=3365096 RepID=UPI0037A0DAC0